MTTNSMKLEELVFREGALVRRKDGSVVRANLVGVPQLIPFSMAGKSFPEEVEYVKCLRRVFARENRDDKEDSHAYLPQFLDYAETVGSQTGVTPSAYVVGNRVINFSRSQMATIADMTVHISVQYCTYT